MAIFYPLLILEASDIDPFWIFFNPFFFNFLVVVCPALRALIPSFSFFYYLFFFFFTWREYPGMIMTLIALIFHIFLKNKIKTSHGGEMPAIITISYFLIFIPSYPHMMEYFYFFFIFSQILYNWLFFKLLLKIHNPIIGILQASSGKPIIPMIYPRGGEWKKNWKKFDNKKKCAIIYM